MTAQEILTLYAARLRCELDYVYGKYGKTRLDLEDFRVRPVEAIPAYTAVVYLALGFLQVQRVHGNHRTLAEALAAHRQLYLRQLLLAVVYHTLQHGAAEPVLKPRRWPRSPGSWSPSATFTPWRISFG